MIYFRVARLHVSTLCVCLRARARTTCTGVLLAQVERIQPAMECEDHGANAQRMP